MKLAEDGGWEFTVSKQLQAVRTRSLDGQYTRRLEVNSPKTHTSVRQVPISNDYAKELLELQFQDMLEGSQPREDDFIFHTSKGTPYDPDNVTKAWKAFLKRNRLPFTQLHGLRHTYATLALEMDSPLDAVTEMLGHSSMKITKDLYASRVKGRARRSLEAFEIAYLTKESGIGVLGSRIPNTGFVPRSPSV